MATALARRDPSPSPAPGLRDFRKPRADLNGKTVLITGGTGSFGRAFVRHALETSEPGRLIVFSRDEQKQ